MGRPIDSNKLSFKNTDCHQYYCLLIWVTVYPSNIDALWPTLYFMLWRLTIYGWDKFCKPGGNHK